MKNRILIFSLVCFPFIVLSQESKDDNKAIELFFSEEPKTLYQLYLKENPPRKIEGEIPVYVISPDDAFTTNPINLEHIQIQYARAMLKSAKSNYESNKCTIAIKEFYNFLFNDVSVETASDEKSSNEDPDIQWLKKLKPISTSEEKTIKSAINWCEKVLKKNSPKKHVIAVSLKVSRLDYPAKEFQLNQSTITLARLDEIYEELKKSSDTKSVTNVFLIPDNKIDEYDTITTTIPLFIRTPLEMDEQFEIYKNYRGEALVLDTEYRVAYILKESNKEKQKTN